MLTARTPYVPVDVSTAIVMLLKHVPVTQVGKESIAIRRNVMKSVYLEVVNFHITVLVLVAGVVSIVQLLSVTKAVAALVSALVPTFVPVSADMEAPRVLLSAAYAMTTVTMETVLTQIHVHVLLVGLVTVAI